MSYNLAFWAGGDDLDPTDTYMRLNGGHHVSDVDGVDRERITWAFEESLPGWRWDRQMLQPPGADPDGTPAFDVSIGAQMIEFVGYGFANADANAVIDAMASLGYRLFDPQVRERFA